MPAANNTYQPTTWTVDTLLPRMEAYPDEAEGLYFYNSYSSQQKAADQRQSKKIRQDSTKKSETLVDTKASIENDSGQKQEGFQADWVFFVLLAILFFFGWLRVVYARRTSQVLKATWSYQQAYSFFMERNYTTVRVSFSLNLLFYLNLGFYLFMLANHLDVPLIYEEPYYNWLLLSAVVAAFSFAYYLLLKIAALFTGAFQSFNEYIFHTFIYMKNIGVYLLPVIIATAYMPQPWPGYVIHLGWALFAGFWFMKVLRGIQLSFYKRVSFFYMFLYLCTLEIAPLLVAYKVTSSLAGS